MIVHNIFRTALRTAAEFLTAPQRSWVRFFSEARDVWKHCEGLFPSAAMRKKTRLRKKIGLILFLTNFSRHFFAYTIDIFYLN